MFVVKLLREGKKESYILDFPFDGELLSNIKLLSNDHRSFDDQTKQWTLHVLGVRELILKYRGRKTIFFEFENDKQKESFKKLVDKHLNRLEKDKEKAERLAEHNNNILEIKSNLPELAKTIDWSQYLKMGVELMDHQEQAAYFINCLESSILALEMGLGKSAVALVACLMKPEIKQVLVICPANLKLNWLMEIIKFTNSTGYVIKYTNGKLVKYRRNEGRKLEECKFIITNYEYFAGKGFNLDKKITNIGINPQILICDESHRLSNKKAQSTDNIHRAFGTRVKRKILLTGTPIRNTLSNLFFALKMVKPEEFSNESKYLTYFCGLHYVKGEGWVKNYETEPKLKELNKKLSTVMFRLKKDVMKDLPKLYINKVYLEMSDEEQKQYNDIESGLAKVDWNNVNVIGLTEEDNNMVIVILSRLRQFTSKIKAKYVRDLIEEFNELDEKVIVFDVFKKPLHELKLALGDNSQVYDGDITLERKQKLVDEFQNKNSKLKNLLISMNAGNSGITLTASNRVFLISQDYSVSSNDQAFSRSHRKGQLLDVFGSIFILADTIDELIDAKLIEKRKTIDAVVDGEDFIDTASISVFSDVINELRKKYES